MELFIQQFNEQTDNARSVILALAKTKIDFLAIPYDYGWELIVEKKNKNKLLSYLSDP